MMGVGAEGSRWEGGGTQKERQEGGFLLHFDGVIVAGIYAFSILQTRIPFTTMKIRWCRQSPGCCVDGKRSRQVTGETEAGPERAHFFIGVDSQCCLCFTGTVK